MEVIGEADIGWELARLWECDSREASLALERRLKHWHGSNQFCPICRGEPVDLLVFLRAGHCDYAAQQAGQAPPSEYQQSTSVREAGDTMNTLDHQIVWIAPHRWQNEITVFDIHSHEGRLYGYATVGQVTWLVQQSTVSSSVWIIVGWVRTAEK